MLCFSVSQEVWILWITFPSRVYRLYHPPHAHIVLIAIYCVKKLRRQFTDAQPQNCAPPSKCRISSTHRVRVSPRANAKWWIVSRHRIAFSLMLWERAAALIVDTRCNFSASAANFDKRANIWKDNTPLARLANFSAEKCNSIRWSHSYTNIKHKYTLSSTCFYSCIILKYF